MPQLPIVLAGPILRRVEPRLVTVWMAFSEPQHLELQLWNGIITTLVPKATDLPSEQLLPPADSPPLLLPACAADTLEVGRHLHVAVIAYEIPANKLPLVPNILYSYNVRFTDQNTGYPRDLRSEGLLFDASHPVTGKKSQLALGMKNGYLPSFSLPPADLEDIVLLHGSCRKMHGIGKEGLAAADYLIAENLLEPKKRPHQLFLTGDQIYADDVPMLVLPHLARQGAALFTGFTEQLTVTPEKKFDAILENFPPNLRGTLTQQHGGMTSDDDDNHLISFFEFAALYLFSFSNRLWPGELANLTADTSEETIDQLVSELIGMVDACNPDTSLLVMTADERDSLAPLPGNRERAAWERNMKLTFRRNLPAILEFRDNLPRVARVLANVPVYMIMDDHEITDDWYITRDWRDKVLTKPLGVNIIRNGMMAYVLFQGWGNDPLAFKSGDNAGLLSAIGQWASGPMLGPTTDHANAIDFFLGFDGSVPKVKLYYNVPTGPTYTYVLDTRTRRSFETRLGTASLMSPDTLLEQLPEVLPNAGTEMVFIVSAAPVLGLAVFEELIQPLMSAAVSNLYADTEAWALDVAGFERFLARIERYKRVVILSGDVHFGFTIWMDYFRSKGVANIADIPRSRIVQLVASAFKNETDKVGNQPILISGRLQQLQGAAYFPAERLGWLNKLNVQVSGEISPRNEIRRHRNPVVFSPHGWNGAAVAPAVPDWAWRLDMVADVRSDFDVAGARPEKIRLAPLSPDVTASDAGYKQVVERHQQAFRKNISRRVVWTSHIGRVQILRQAGKLSVDHQFWYRLPEDGLNDLPFAYTEHITSLEPTTDAPPTLI